MTLPSGPPLSFDDVRRLLFPDAETRKILGPASPLDDARLCAGLLFERWNDRTERLITNSREKWPRIVVSWNSDLSSSRSKNWVVRREIMNLLLDEGVIEVKPFHSSIAASDELRLSAEGKRLVVTTWFCKDGMAMTDLFKATGAFDISAGEIRRQSH